jgi:hypothetical protein
LKLDTKPGDERVIMVHGDLAQADRVIIHIPGAGTDLDDVRDGGNPDALSLYHAAERAAPGQNIALVFFMDYNVPDTVEVAGIGLPDLEAVSPAGARDGALRLRGFVQDLRESGIPADRVSVVAHSYGSVVAGTAMQQGLDVQRVIAAGSPGMGADAPGELRHRSPGVELFATEALLDPYPAAPGHGPPPTDFDGVGTFPADGLWHSSYFKEGTGSLRTIATLAVGGRPR